MNKLQYLFVLLGFIVLVQCEEEMPTQANLEYCLKESNLTQEQFDELEKNDSGLPEDASEEELKRIKCFSHCILKQSDVLDARGKIDMDKLQEYDQMEEEEVKVVLDCKAEHDVETDPCEYSFNMLNCVIDNLAEKDI